MKSRTLLNLGLFGSLFSMPLALQAAELNIDGFASIYYGQVINEDELDDAHPTYLEYDGQADFQPDSLYGIQFRGDLKDNLSVTAQFVGRGIDEFDTKINWAYLTYNINDEFSVKAGRQRIPLFIYSDFYDVGYAYQWVRPPASVYDVEGFENSDGVSLEYLTDLVGWTSRLNVLFGKEKTTVDFEGNVLKVDNDDVWNLSWNMNYEWFTYQLMYQRSKVTVSSYNELAAAIEATMAQFFLPPLSIEQSGFLDINNDEAIFYEAGVSIDLSQWVFAFEHSVRDLKNSPVQNKTKSWYAMAAYRWNKLTVAVTHDVFKNENTKETLQILDGIQPIFGAVPAVAELNAALDSAYRIGQEASANRVSVRYDFHSSAAFKIELIKTDIEYDQGRGTIIDSSPLLLRMGVDLVF